MITAIKTSAGRKSTKSLFYLAMKNIAPGISRLGSKVSVGLKLKFKIFTPPPLYHSGIFHTAVPLEVKSLGS